MADCENRNTPYEYEVTGWNPDGSMTCNPCGKDPCACDQPCAPTKRDELSGNPFNPAFNYYRASGDAICATCGQRYGDHPTVRARERWHYGVELFVLCNTDRVKT